ncbi:MAG: nucleotidyltransferase domain-containing protein [Acidimicrobiia bacterium]
MKATLTGFFAAHGVELMAAFGSTIVEAATADDLDLAVAIREEADLYSLIADLVEMLRFDRIDVVDLETADVVLAAEALRSVFRSSSPIPAYTLAQMAALTERMETAYLRRLDLELLTS